MNIAFTALYNLVGLSLAALGYLPPILAAAAQSLPDLGILANASRLLKQEIGAGRRSRKGAVWRGATAAARAFLGPSPGR